MKFCNFLEEQMNEDIIEKIYNNNLDFSEKSPETIEYIQIMKQIKKQEKEWINIKEKYICEKFKYYLETRNVKDALEAQWQFKLGFKTAIKVMIEALKN